MKSKKVIRTKNFSIKQSQNMVSNLRYAYKVYSSIDIHISSFYKTGSDKIEFWIYIEGTHSKYLGSWKETQDTYFKLMEESNG